MFSIRVQDWMFVRITKSSSALESLRQLFRFASTVSSENWLEQGPPFAPLEHPQPYCKNFLTLSIISCSFLFWSLFVSAMVNRWSFSEWCLLSWSLTRAKCYPSNGLTRVLIGESNKSSRMATREWWTLSPKKACLQATIKKFMVALTMLQPVFFA